MIDLSPLAELLIFAANLTVLALLPGMAVALVIQPNRAINSYAFAGLAGSVALWALGGLLHLLLDLAALTDATLLLRLLVTGVMGTAAGMFTFAVVVLKPEGRLVRVLSLALPVILMAGLSLVWIGDAIQVDVETGTLLVSDAWRVVLAGSTAYAGLAFWVVISSRSYNAPMLRVPTGLGVAAFASLWLLGVEPVPVGLLVMGAAVFYAGQTLLRKQVRTPVEELNTELRIANRDLQQVINDLAAEKEKTDNLNRELREANRYKSEFLANISHELRTPLNSILGYSELLRSGIYGQLSEKQSDRLEKIHRNGTTLLDLISDILDLNKIDAGKMRLELAPFTMPEIIDLVLAEHDSALKEKSLALQREVAADLPELYGDHRRISQVVNNLVDNAVKFTREGSVTVAAQRVQVSGGLASDFDLPALGWLHDGEWVIVSVTDTGIGIPVEEQGRIFTEFLQVDGSHTREFGGTGLGLAISKRLVDMHSGTIWLRSTVDVGSSFFVALPADPRTVANRAEEGGDGTVVSGLYNAP